MPDKKTTGSSDRVKSKTDYWNSEMRTEGFEPTHGDVKPWMTSSELTCSATVPRCRLRLQKHVRHGADRTLTHRNEYLEGPHDLLWPETEQPFGTFLRSDRVKSKTDYWNSEMRTEGFEPTHGDVRPWTTSSELTSSATAPRCSAFNL